MKILAIDSATEACSAALWLDGDVETRFELAARRHTERLLPMADELLQEAGLTLARLDAIAFGRGPGSFTGVRIATAAAQGMAWAAGLPVAPVSTLAALAQAAIDRHQASAIACAIDARMGEVYWACYRRDDDGLAQLEGEERVSPPDTVPPLAEPSSWQGVGSGWGIHRDALLARIGGQPARIDAAALPEAALIARIAAETVANGDTVEPAAALPVYLRDKVTHQRTPSRRG